MKWYEAPLVVIDFETTGFRPPVSIIEIGAVRFERGEVVDELELLVKPTLGRIEKGASKVHGLYEGDVVDQPTFLERYPLLRDFCRQAVPVSYGDCDQRWLHEELNRLRRYAYQVDEQIPAFSRAWGPWIDVLRWAREMYPVKGRGRHKLDAMCEKEGIAIPESHRAIDDARATAGLLWKWHDAGWLPDVGISEMLKAI